MMRLLSFKINYAQSMLLLFTIFFLHSALANSTFNITEDYAATPLSIESNTNNIQSYFSNNHINSETKFYLKNITFKGNKIYKTQLLQGYFKNHLGKYVSCKELQSAMFNIQTLYTTSGYVLATLVIPKQIVTNGNLTIIIYEGHVSKVNLREIPDLDFKNNDELLKAEANAMNGIPKPNDPIRNLLNEYGNEIKKQDPITSDEINRIILLIKKINGIEIKSISLGPIMSDYGTGELNIAYQKAKYDFHLAYGNYFMENTNQSLQPINGQIIQNTLQNIQVGAGVSNVFFDSDRLFAQFWYVPNYTQNLDQPQDFSGSYQTLLNKNGLTSEISFDSYQSSFLTQNVANLKFAYPVLLQENNQINSFVSIGNTSSTQGTYVDTVNPLRVSIENINSNSYIKNYSKIDLSQGLNLGNASIQGFPSVYTTNFSSLRYYDNFYINMPFLPSNSCLNTYGSPQNNQESHANNLSCSRFPVTVLLGSEGQFSPNSLVPSETFGFGNYDFGRGYAYNSIYGDSGVAGKVELQINNAFADNRFLLKQMQIYLFSDYGVAFANQTDAYLNNATQGWSTGAGSRFFIAKSVKADFFLAVPLLNANQTGTNDLNVYPFFFISSDFQ